MTIALAVVGAIIGLTLVGTMVVVAGAGRAAPLSGLCGTCHAMTPRVETWRVSTHAKTGCYSCHAASYAWYDFPGNLFGSASMLRRTEQPPPRGHAELSAAAEAGPLIPDAVCGACHDPARAPSSSGAVIIDHVDHATRNRSCLSCHLEVGHLDVTQDQALASMSLCFNCHGKSATPTASRACVACHPADFDLEPPSHKVPTWAKPDHGLTALDDRDRCMMCHLGGLCIDCHGVVMPHPTDWRDGAQGHAGSSADDRPVCAKCHQAAPDPCSTCHHAEHDPARGPWAEEHQWVVRDQGTAPCFTCHEPTFCQRCHLEE
jgi:hypothetical protein